METEIIEVKQADMLSAINRSEVDIQIATAKQYPRDIQRALNSIKTIATLDPETAEDCFYVLKRGRGDDASIIEGVSVRLAEIIAGAWGNLRVATRIIGNDGRTITAQAVCHDLETNVAVSLEVKRRITDRNGRTYSEDMQVMTGNAASAIAYRNAVLKVVPKAVTKRVIQDIKQVAMGQALSVETSRQRMIDYFAKLGVSQAEIFTYLEVKSVAEIDAEMIFELRGLCNALKEGTTTIQDTFKRHTADSEAMAEAARKKSQDKRNKVANAMAQSETATGGQATAPTTEAEAVDVETGEVIAVESDNSKPEKQSPK